MATGPVLLGILVLGAGTTTVLSNENATPTSGQDQNAVTDEVQICRQSFPNATDPWMGQPEDASLDNMCLVKCVLEYQKTIVNGSIVCANLAQVVQQEVLNLRAMHIDIDEAGWRTSSEKCCQDAIEADVSVGDESDPQTPPEDVAMCMRAHFLWHCDFQTMWQNIPPEQQKKLIEKMNTPASQTQNAVQPATNGAPE